MLGDTENREMTGRQDPPIKGDSLVLGIGIESANDLGLSSLESWSIELLQGTSLFTM